MGIKCGTDMGIKCVILMSYFASFLRFYVFDLFFCNGCNVVLTSYTAISIKECHRDNSQMCNMGAERMMGIIIVLNKFSISVASWGYFQRQLPMQM
jgi:hypothetical protein